MQNIKERNYYKKFSVEAGKYIRIGLEYLNKKDFDMSLINFEIASKIDSNSSHIYRLIGFCHKMKKNNILSIKYFKKAKKCSIGKKCDDFVARLDLADFCRGVRLYKESFEEYLSLSKIEPDNSYVWMQMAEIKYCMGKYEQATKLCLKAMNVT